MELTATTVIAIPASILSLIGVLTLFVKYGRNDGRKAQIMTEHTKKITEHGNLLKQCQEKGLVSADQCRDTQTACVKSQKEANAIIISDIKELKAEIRRNRSELKGEAESERREVHEILRKLSSDVGTISGIVGRFRFDKEGRLVL